MLLPMTEAQYGEWVAKHYDELHAERCAPEAVDPVVDFLVERAGDGPVLELGIGTGRIAVPLSRRGVQVHGIELAPAMVAQLRTKTSEIEVTIGDFANTTAAGRFSLVYLVYNTITNLTTQDEQVECFRNAAAHLEPGGRFVIENYIPHLQRLPPGETKYVFDATPTHVGIEEYDVAAQLAVSHHWSVVDGVLRVSSSTHRYLWPAELDLMACMAGLELRERWAGWDRSPFTAESRSHLSVWQKP